MSDQETVETITLTKEVLLDKLKNSREWMARAILRVYDAYQAGKLQSMVLTPNTTDPKYDEKARLEYCYAWIKQGRNITPRDSEIMEKVMTQQVVIDYLFNLIAKNPNGPRPEQD
jgi:hypothetical protein